jgi:hypothetical protein
MPKYKISKSNLNEFFGWFGKSKKPKDLQTVINNDPILKRLDADITDLNRKASAYIKKDKEYMNLLKKYGIEID